MSSNLHASPEAFDRELTKAAMAHQSLVTVALASLATRRCNQTISRVLGPRLPRVRVGRNAPCPCGSGKKFKKCCRP